jgi:hypothetical protein
LLRSPRPDWTGVGNPLRCFTATSAPTRGVTPSGCSPVVIRRPLCADSPSVARWTPEGLDRVSALLLGSFLYFYWAVLYSPSFEGPPCNCTPMLIQ